jgi:hypothetical protein
VDIHIHQKTPSSQQSLKCCTWNGDTINRKDTCTIQIQSGGWLQLWPCFTLLARCCHKYWMKGTCLRNGAKSRAIRYNSLVFPGDDGMHTCSWWRCVGHASTSEPSSFPGFSSPIVESTMHGGWNSMAIGYGSQVPRNFAIGVLNFTKLQKQRV